MSDKDLLREYKNTISDLTKDKKELTDTIVEKDSRIKKILIQLEQANQDVQSAGKKIAELEKKLNKKQTIKRVIDEKITEVLENIEEKKVSESVDKEDTDMLKEVYEKNNIFNNKTKVVGTYTFIYAQKVWGLLPF